jgi:uncharacterized cupredoxin-like copper-binding protein/YHS domain-containing protein
VVLHILKQDKGRLAFSAGDTTYYFCSRGCRPEFEADPVDLQKQAIWRCCDSVNLGKVSRKSETDKRKASWIVKRSIALLMALAAGILAGCSSLAGQSPTAIRVDAQEFSFTPAQIEVVAGQPVTITFKNTGTLEHDWSIMEIPVEIMSAADTSQHSMAGMTMDPQLHTSAMNGQSGTLTFTPTKPGTYEFFCTVPGHKEAGMHGTLIVTAP